MKKERGLEVFVIVTLAIAVLVMSVGFAAFSANLNLTGTVTVKEADWDIHFDKTSYALSTGDLYVKGDDAPTPTITDQSITFTATLSEPQDIYEFTINVVNAGTFDAVLDSITMSSLTDDQAKLLTYTLTYDGTAYTKSQTGINNELAKMSGTTPTAKVLKVTVAYKDISDETLLPSEDMTVNLTATLGFKQKARTTSTT